MDDTTQPKTLLPNQYWGRQSGKYTETEGGTFKQIQMASGKERKGKSDKCQLINIPHKWFKG